MSKQKKSYAIWAIPVFVVMLIAVFYFFKYMNYKSSRDSLADALEAVEVEDDYRAVANFNNSFVYDPECAECYHEYAKYEYYNNGFPEGAYNVMVKAMAYYEDEEKTDEVYEFMGKICYRFGHFDSALEYFSSMKENTDSSSFYKILLVAKDGDFVTAKKDLSEFEKQYGGDAKVYDALARLSVNLEQYEETKAFCEKALELNPELAQIYYIKSKALFMLGDTTGEGCKALNIALDKKVEDREYFRSKYCKDIDFNFTY